MTVGVSRPMLRGIHGVPAPSSVLPPHVAARVTVSHAGCWLWGGAVDRCGYGLASIGGKMFRLHRWAFQAANGPVAAELDMDHLCRVKSCCNPLHLEPVTHHVNLLRGATTRASTNQRKTSCANGHPFSEDNTYRWGTSRGTPRRYCRACKRMGRKSAARKARAASKDVRPRC